MKIPAGRDTTDIARKRQAAAVRSLPPARRLALAVEMSLAARGLLEARLRAEHPDWSAADCARETRRILLPPDLARHAAG